MKNKQIIISFIILCLIGAYYFFFEVKKKNEDEAALKQKETLFKGMQKDNITEVSLYGSSGKIALKKEGGSWFLETPLHAPADSAMVDEMTGQFSGALYKDTIEGAGFYEYGLTTPTAGVVLTDSAGKKYAMNFGIATATGENAYASVAGNTHTVYIVTGILKGEADKKLFDWRDKRVLGNLNADLVTKIQVNLKGKKYTLSKEADGWNITSPFKDKARKARVESLITSVRSAQATAIDEIKPDILSRSSLKNPAEYISFNEGNTLNTVYFGRDDLKKSTVFSKGSYQTGVFELPDYVYKNIQKAEDMVDKRIAGISEADIKKLAIKYDSKQLTAVKTVKKNAPPVWEITSVSNISDKEKPSISPSAISYAISNLEYKQKISTGNKIFAGQDYGFSGGCEITAYGDNDLVLCAIDTGNKLKDKNEIYLKKTSSGDIYSVDAGFVQNLNLPGLEVK